MQFLVGFSLSLALSLLDSYTLFTVIVHNPDTHFVMREIASLAYSRATKERNKRAR